MSKSSATATSMDQASYKYNKKPVPDRVTAPKKRNCLSCGDGFNSTWAGERICPRCKSSSSWRSGLSPI